MKNYYVNWRNSWQRRKKKGNNVKKIGNYEGKERKEKLIWTEEARWGKEKERKFIWEKQDC